MDLVKGLQAWCTSHGAQPTALQRDCEALDGDDQATLRARELLVSLHSAAVHSNVAHRDDNGQTTRRTRRGRQPRIETDRYGRTPLHYAANWGCTQVIRAARLVHSAGVLPTAGAIKESVAKANATASTLLAGINLRDNESGWTPLHRALYRGHFGTALELLQLEGVDVTLKDHDGLDAMDLLRTLLPLVTPRTAGHITDLLPTPSKQCATLIPPSVDVDEETNEEEHDCSEPADREQPRTTLYTWGRNANYLLGHADQSDRARPDRVALHVHAAESTGRQMGEHTSDHPTNTAASIRAMSMSRLHTAVVLDTTVNSTLPNLLTCGFGRGGRLGNSEATRFILQPVLGVTKVMTAACGRDHTVAVTQQGHVYTFGDNRWGQLGYTLPSTGKSDGTGAVQDAATYVQLEPRRVLGLLRTVTIIGCAASTVHTAVFTRDALYTFGQDQGQLGYDTKSDRQIQPRQVIHLPGQRILQVVATDRATVCLLAGGEVYTLTQQRCQRVVFSAQRLPAEMPSHQPASVPAPHVVRLVSDTEMRVGALTAWGDIFTWSTASMSDQAQLVGKCGKLPRRSWTACDAGGEAVDVGIGHDASIIVCTRAGQVWISREKGRFERVPAIHRAVRVCAGTSGSWAVLRSEPLHHPAQVTASSLPADLGAALYGSDDPTKMTATALRQVICDSEDAICYGDRLGDIHCCVGNISVACHSVVLSSRSHRLRELLLHGQAACTQRERIAIRYRPDPQPQLEVVGCSLEVVLCMLEYIYTGACQTMPQEESEDIALLAELLELPGLRTRARSGCGSRLERPLSVSLGQVCESIFTNTEPAPFTDVILALQDRRVAVHRAVISHRSPFFAALLRHDSPWLEGRGSTPSVDFSHRPWSTMRHVLEFIYSGTPTIDVDAADYESMDGFFSEMEELLSTADELMMDRFRQLCEQKLRQYVTMRSVFRLIDMADRYHAEQLQSICYEYLCLNLDAALESRLLLAKANSGIIDRLEDTWRQRVRSHIPDIDAVQPSWHAADWPSQEKSHPPTHKERTRTPRDASTTVVLGLDTTPNRARDSITAEPPLATTRPSPAAAAVKQPRSALAPLVATSAKQSPSPTATSTQPSLKEIMQQQQEQHQRRQSSAGQPRPHGTGVAEPAHAPADHTPPAGTSTPAAIPIQIKSRQSQRERKRERQVATQARTVSPRNTAGTVPWGAAPSSNPTHSPASLRDIQAQQQRQRRPPPATKCTAANSSQSPSSGRGQTSRATPAASSSSPATQPAFTDAFPALSEPPPRAQQNRRRSSAANRTTLAEIQQEQAAEKLRQQELRNAKRSLVDIQTEELVVQAWREYYASLGVANWEPPPGFHV